MRLVAGSNRKLLDWVDSVSCMKFSKIEVLQAEGFKVSTSGSDPVKITAVKVVLRRVLIKYTNGPEKNENTWVYNSNNVLFIKISLISNE